MPLEPEVSTPPENNQQQNALRELHPLESLFTLGYAQSPVMEIYKDEKVEFKVKFRTLTPAETRDVTEEITKYFSPTGQVITEQIETLARAIVHVNYMPLILVSDEQQEFFKANNRNPSPLDMAKVVLRDKIKALVVLNAMYTAYLEFSEGITKEFLEAKKKSRILKV